MYIQLGFYTNCILPKKVLKYFCAGESIRLVVYINERLKKSISINRKSLNTKQRDLTKLKKKYFFSIINLKNCLKRYKPS